MTITQLELGDLLKEAGQQLATIGSETWHDNALRWIESLRLGQTFTADDLVEMVGLPRESEANRNNAVGACFSAARKRGLIRQSGDYHKSTRPESHSRIIAVWVRL